MGGAVEMEVGYVSPGMGGAVIKDDGYIGISVGRAGVRDIVAGMSGSGDGEDVNYVGEEVGKGLHGGDC